MTSREPATSTVGGQYGAIAFRDLGDGRGLWVYPMLFTAKLAIGELTNKTSFDDAWCYKNDSAAIEAMNEWDPNKNPEPEGWVRHPHTGRRRFPDGDPSTETESI